MKYVEFHEYVRRNAILYAYLLNNFSHTFKKLKAGEMIVADQEHVLLMRKGTLIEESNRKKKGITRCFFQKSFIFPTIHEVKLKALETTEICNISAESVFGKLEEDKILSNFFLQIAEKTELDLKRQEMLGTEAPKNKIMATLDFLLDNYWVTAKLPVFPKWLQINMLAKLANCSVSSTSSVVNELHNQGVLDIKSSPWKMKETEKMFETNMGKTLVETSS
ncbi:Crp/Fnr family transcriptional regulator [Listeria ilorinensis]|uniref:Crp/Fnr family transcriptional regulator n=1 Tax=Listeria ilorinensis TaxID=2867439 RepID=UPI001EF66B2D|nr:Crp/Fnr family transcriptional regulator [Listeria ilorinensis]